MAEFTWYFSGCASGILVKIVQLSPHLGEHIWNEVIASRYNSRIFNPLQTSGILGCSRTFFYDGILELLVLLAQLLRDGLKTLEYAGLVLLIRILYHIVFVGTNNISLHVQHFIQSFGVNEGLHHIRHTAHRNSSKSNGLMSMVVSYPTGIDFGSFP